MSFCKSDQKNMLMVGFLTCNDSDILRAKTGPYRCIGYQTNIPPTVYHDTLEWYNERLFSDQEGDEDEKELIQMDDNEDEDDPNITYCRRRQQQWEEESYTPTVS